MYNFRYIFANCMKGQRKYGVENPGKYVKNILKKYNKLSDINNVTIPSRYFKNLKGYSNIRYEVHNSIIDGKIPFTIGGDHSISIGSLTGTLEHYGDTLSTVWVDAHGDINTFASSPSKNLHGMSLAFLTGLNDNPLTRNQNKLSFENLVYFGIRHLDTFEREIIKKHKIKNINSDILMSNVNIDDIIDIKTENIHLSVDVDVLDPGLMTSTGTPVPNGIDLNKLEELINWTKQSGNIVAIDLVEFNPKCENNKQKRELDFKNYEKLIEILHTP